MSDNKNRIIVLYDIYQVSNIPGDCAVYNYTYLANEISSQHIHVECIDNIAEVLDVASKEDYEGEVTLRRDSCWVVGLSIEPFDSEMEQTHEILTEFLDRDFDIDTLNGRIILANFTNDDLEDINFLQQLEEQETEESSDLPEPPDDDEDDL